MPVLTFPDGAQRSYDAGVTGLDVAKAIAPSLAKKSIAVKLDGVSGSLLDRKIANIEQSGADTLVATDVSCLMHIAGGLRRRGSAVVVRHIAEVLADVGPDAVPHGGVR